MQRKLGRLSRQSAVPGKDSAGLFCHWTLAAMMLIASVNATAAVVKYDATWTPTFGPAGTGSFYFDSGTGAITDFTWNFGNGAYVGGVVDGTFGSQDAGGDTRGRFVFEMLSDLNVHATSNCDFCSVGEATPSFFGGPLGAGGMYIFGAPSAGATYWFGTTLVFNDANKLASGAVTVAPAPVPLPAAAWLLLSSLAGLGFVGRRKAR